MGLPVIATNWRWAAATAGLVCCCRCCWCCCRRRRHRRLEAQGSEPRSGALLACPPLQPMLRPPIPCPAAAPLPTWMSRLATRCPLRGWCLWARTAAPLQVGSGQPRLPVLLSRCLHGRELHGHIPHRTVHPAVLIPPAAPAGHRWANPSVRQLVRLMQHVVAHRQEAESRGLAARRHLAASYSPDAVAELVAQQLRRIEIGLAA